VRAKRKEESEEAKKKATIEKNEQVGDKINIPPLSRGMG
jgi:hypothetical protein